MKKIRKYQTPLSRFIDLTTTTLLNGSEQQTKPKKFQNVNQKGDQNLPTFDWQWGNADEAS